MFVCARRRLYLSCSDRPDRQTGGPFRRPWSKKQQQQGPLSYRQQHSDSAHTKGGLFPLSSGNNNNNVVVPGNISTHKAKHLHEGELSYDRRRRRRGENILCTCTQTIYTHTHWRPPRSSTPGGKLVNVLGVVVDENARAWAQPQPQQQQHDEQQQQQVQQVYT